MTRSVLLTSLSLILIGFLLTYGLLWLTFQRANPSTHLLKEAVETIGLNQPTIIGFLPYWLLSKADKPYPDYLTTLTYFGLVVQHNGTIQTEINPGEAEPGWYALKSGKVTPFLTQARNQDLTLSLLVFNGQSKEISQLISQPASHAATLVSAVAPFMKEHHFTDLNLDIESVEHASASARLRFTEFVQAVDQELHARQLGTLTIDSSPSDLIKSRLIDLEAVEPFVDTVVLMTYDYHFMGSAVTGPVAPLGGAGTQSEFDTETAIQKALTVLPPTKTVLGVPLYGYQWETLSDSTRSATLPGSGLTVSHRTMEQFLANCATCSAEWDPVAQEASVQYIDATGTTIQAFFPDAKALQAKLHLAQTYGLNGVALWAIGYEGENLLEPLKEYKQSLK